MHPLVCKSARSRDCRF